MTSRHSGRLNTGLVDWLTVTSFEKSIWSAMMPVMNDVSHGLWENEKSQAKIMQYDGYMLKTPGDGHLFLGSGKQKGKDNVMIRASGAISNDLFAHDFIKSVVTSGLASVTRLDLQVTTIQPKDWSQWELMSELKNKGVNVGWFSSIDRVSGQELATIYVGSRSSNRFTRIYEKLSKSADKLLRWETEYKSERAQHIAIRLMTDMKGAEWKFLSYEMQRIHSKTAERAMAGVLDVDSAVSIRLTKVQHVDKTYEWLMGVCVPVIDRYLKQHDYAASVLMDTLQAMLNNAIQAWEERTGDE